MVDRWIQLLRKRWILVIASMPCLGLLPVTPAIAADLGIVSMLEVELLCTAPTGSQAHSQVVNSLVCGSDEFPFPDEFDFGDSIGCIDPLKSVRGLANMNALCAQGKARVDEFMTEVCGNALGTTAQNILANDAGFRSQTTSLVLPNGNILHQWSARCPILFLDPEG